MRPRAPAILTNAQAAECRPPILFEPPRPLVRFPELWIVTTGDRSAWGGAAVAWSEDGDHYEDVARIGMYAIAGRLLDPLPAAWSVDVRVAIDDEGELASVDAAAAQRLQTECYVGDGRNVYEVLAFTGMTLLGRDDHAFVYCMHGFVRRGAYGTAVRAWPAGSRFARLNAEVARIALPHRLVAARAELAVKLVSTNAAGDVDSMDDPAEAEPVPFTIAGIAEGAW